MTCTPSMPGGIPMFRGTYIFISPDEVFGDIMVLTSLRPCPPIDPEDVNTQNRKISLSNFICG